MALGETDLRRIGDYVKTNMYGWLVEVAPQVVSGPQILERIERIEERLAALDQKFVTLQQEMVVLQQELKAQRELMDARFRAVDVRFEDMNKRFNGMQWLVGGGFVLLALLMTVYDRIV